MRVNFAAELDISAEIPEAEAPGINPDFNTVTIDQYSIADQLTDETTPAVEGEPIDLSHTLVGTSDDLDLTAAPVATRIGDTVDLTGKRLLAMKLVAPADNAGAITIKTAAANGYPLGAGITLYPGEDVLLIKRTGASSTRPTVAGARRYLTIDGTDSDVLQILAAFGDS